jgi:hypothetical protein
VSYLDKPPKSISIPSRNLPSSGSYYVTVRAVNGDGDVSETVTTGPAAYDTSPPPAPTLTTHYSDPTLAVEARNMGDPESGLGPPPNGTSKNTVWWQVRPLLDTTRVLREGAFYASNLGTGTFNDSKQMTLSRSSSAMVYTYGYRVVLTLENGAGMTRTVTTTRVADPVSSWSSTAKQRWKRGADALLQDGIAATRTAQAVNVLNGYGPAKRSTLLQNLDQATSASQRKQVLKTIEQGAP